MKKASLKKDSPSKKSQAGSRTDTLKKSSPHAKALKKDQELALVPVSEIKGPDNPTRQLLSIISTKCCSGDGAGRKDKGGGGGWRSKTKLCVTKFYVKAGV